jgi:hypothetical protein
MGCPQFCGGSSRESVASHATTVAAIVWLAKYSRGGGGHLGSLRGAPTTCKADHVTRQGVSKGQRPSVPPSTASSPRMNRRAEQSPEPQDQLIALLTRGASTPRPPPSCGYCVNTTNRPPRRRARDHPATLRLVSELGHRRLVGAVRDSDDGHIRDLLRALAQCADADTLAAGLSCGHLFGPGAGCRPGARKRRRTRPGKDLPQGPGPVGSGVRRVRLSGSGHRGAAGG